MPQAITLNLTEGTLRFNFSPAAAQSLQADLAVLMNQLKAGATGPSPDSPRRLATSPLEYRHTGDVFLEVFCNPNIWPSPFAAKALITIRDDRIRLTTEAALSQLYEDISSYLENAA
ncbi:MAG TPA: hypothetical protein IGR64_00675 [Leptolyngbyaceae cyanobacterium M65_K2018_010]|nr:hypothetical protein [Leptolyngbyaceae cyanobacterium M65_K2018_010]